MTEARTGREYDRWLGGGSLTGRGFRFLASVPGSMIVNTPIFRLDKNLILKPEHRVLDIGCGSGSLLRVVASRVQFDEPPVGIDLSRAMLRAGWPQEPLEGPPIELIQAAGTHVPLRSELFDIVTCSYVLKHLDDAGVARLLAEVLRVLRPGGFAVIWEFAPVRSPRLNRWHEWLLTRGVQTCNLRSYGDLAHMATSAGFEWVENAHLRPFLLPPIPRVSIVAGKAPEEWRERTGPGRARRAVVEGARSGNAPESLTSDTDLAP